MRRSAVSEAAPSLRRSERERAPRRLSKSGGGLAALTEFARTFAHVPAMAAELYARPRADNIQGLAANRG